MVAMERSTSLMSEHYAGPTMARRALRERRAQRQAQHMVVSSRRWVAAAAASSRCCSLQRPRLEEMRRNLMARRRVYEQQQQQQQQQQQHRHQPNSTISTIAPSLPPSSSANESVAVSAAGPAPVAPEVYLKALLSQRGRLPRTTVNSVEAGYSTPPSKRQVDDYEAQPYLSGLARRGDMEGLQKAVDSGRGMDACNKFGESVVHIACRRGNLDLIRFLVANGGSLTACDDLGRFPLHEVCWAAQPRFDLVRVFLEEEREANTRRRSGSGSSSSSSTSTMSSCSGSDSAGSDADTTATARDSDVNDEGSDTGAGDGGDLNMLLVTDKRGNSPLRYVQEESWPQWRRFMDEVVDEFWPSLSPATP